MAQASDYTVNNSTGANVRQDINTIFEAIATNNSGASAPSNTKPTQFFADTTNGMLKLRNTSNNGYVNFRKLDGSLPLPDGSASSPSLFFDDDTNTGIFSGGADEINISTGGEERFVINSSGNCGIGIESPARILHLHESSSETCQLHITNSATGTTGNDGISFALGSDESLIINQRESNVITLKTADQARMTINSSGNVAIGTPNPDQTLHVHKASAGSITSHSNSVLTLENNATAILQFLTPSNANAQIRFGDPADNGAGFIQYNHSDNAIQFGTNGPEKIRIDSDGRLGVGEQLPSEKIHIADGNLRLKSSNTSGYKVKIGNAATGDDDFLGAVSGFWNDNEVAIVGFRSGTDTTNKDDGIIFFGTSESGSNPATRMVINNTGNVGIGTALPNSRLHVVDSISGGGNGVITATDSSSNDFGVGLAIRKTTTTTSSSQRFIQFFANGVTQPMGGIVGNGAEQAQFLQLSDERCKKNIKPLSGILDKVNKLKTVSFDWKHINESVEAGFIAQNVQELFPEYVIKNIANEGEEEKMGTTGGMTGGFIAVLTAAIQELSAKVEALETA